MFKSYILPFLLMIMFTTASAMEHPLLRGETSYNGSAAVHLSIAHMMIRDGKMEEAEEELRLALKEDPRSEVIKARLSDVLFQLEKYKDVIRLLRPIAHAWKSVEIPLYLGLAYQYVGDMDKAMDTYDTIYHSDSAGPGDWIHVGRILSLSKKYKDALRFYRRAEERMPESAELQGLIGDTYIAMEDREHAEDAYRKATELDPKGIKNWVVLAQLAESKKEWKEALGFYGTALGLATDPSSMIQDLIRVSLKLGDFNQALEITKGIVEKHPEEGTLWEVLGILYYQVGSLEEANRAFDRAVEKGVDTFQLYLTRGRSLLELDNPEKAVESLKKAVSLKPDEFIGWINLALAYFSLEKDDDALTSLQKAEEIRPESAQALYLRGLILNRQKKYAEAVGPLEKAQAASPENKDILFSLAVAYERSGRRKEAEDLLQKVIQADPKDGEALNYLGYMWAERGEHLEEAGDLIKRALEIDPDNGYFIDSIAWVYYQQGRYQKALDEMLRSVELVKDDPVILEHLGDIYQKLGLIEEARETWRRSLEIKPDNPDLRERLEKISPSD
jgi:tetratricopeptide (TPR) repeat protein